VLKKSVALVVVMLIVALFCSVVNAQVQSITVAVNTAPWLPAFRELAKKFEQDTGVKVDIRAFPFTGLPEKVLAACLSETSEFDVVTLAEGSVSSFYGGGFLMPINEIDPTFKPDDELISYNGLNYWDEELQYTSETGEMLTFPVNGNIQIFYYRKDLYDAAGLDAPQTWEDVIAAAELLQDPAKGFYGYAVRGQKAVESVSWDWYPFLRQCGGDIFKNAPYDYTVTLDTPEAKKALELYAKLAQLSPPDASNMGQAEQIAMLSAGNLLQTIVVAGANAQMDDPNQSVVPGKIGYVPVPHPADGTRASNSGTLSMGIPRNLPRERQVAALEFLKYVTSQESQQYFAEHGGVPVRTDAMDDNGKDNLRFLVAVRDSVDMLVNMPRVGVFQSINDVLETRLNEVVAGTLSVDDALNLMQDEITAIMQREGYIE
jgi:multiple sugar transport system substrate-binding protein